jgi:hypothetical protein
MLRTKVRKATLHESLRMIILVVLPVLAEPGNVIIIISVATRSRRMVLETTAASGRDATGSKGQSAS